jgi:hypothetical protein
MGAGDRRDLDKFIDETRGSQRNIVFPDTVRNARAVDVFLWRGSPDPTLVQRIGAWLFGLAILGYGVRLLWDAAQARADHEWVEFGVMILMSLGFISIGIRLFRNGFPRDQKTRPM